MEPYYQGRGVVLYHGDCRDVLPALERESADLLLTDPPYGQRYTGHRESGMAYRIRGDGPRQASRLLRQAMFEVEPVLRDDAHALVFCAWDSWPDFFDACSSLLPVKNALIWHKAMGGTGNTRQDYARDYEVVLYAAGPGRAIEGKRDGAVIRGFRPPPYQRRTHPTEKPVALLEYLVRRHAPPGGLVLDAFAGSGSALVAAAAAGRRAIGVEIEERYCEAAAWRLEALEEPEALAA